MPGFIAMMSVLVVVGIEMFFATKGAGHSHGGEYGSVPSDGHEHEHESRPEHRRADSMKRFRDIRLGDDLPGSTENLVSGTTPEASPAFPRKQNPRSGDEDEDSDLELDELDPVEDANRPLNGSTSRANGHPASNSYPGMMESGSQIKLSEKAEQDKMLLQCLLLEAGILFHSVFIGMALSVATGTAFVVLLVAISFHREDPVPPRIIFSLLTSTETFEGLALGSRIAAITSFPKSSPKPWLMALAYGTTTPIGQAIGLIIHNMYDPASQTGLLTVGVMNAISSGLLLFAGLVELLAEDFLSDKSYVVLKGKKRLQACASVVSGALLMALIGAWA
jgi:solute carrier family 39 (zinc transporter), member 1/2/3